MNSTRRRRRAIIIASLALAALPALAAGSAAASTVAASTVAASTVAASTGGTGTASHSAAGSLGRLGPQNPFMAPGGVGSVHNDSESQNVTPQPGPGTGPLNPTLFFSGTVCPTILLETDGLVTAYCLGTTSPYQPSLRLLDPKNLTVLASLSLPPTGQFGVYPYLDQADRVVIATGAGHIMRLAPRLDSGGTWHLDVAGDWDVSQSVLGHCGGTPMCDYIVSAKPGWDGRIWFSTAGGVVGVLDTATGTARSVQLPAGEQVTKAISSSPAGVAVVSDHALYLFRANDGGAPAIAWREPYQRGSGTRPGQVADGSGTAPTFFGLAGDQYLTIIDNAVPREHVLVYRVSSARGDDRLVCAVPVFSPGASATDNTSIGIGNTVIASNTAGYDFSNPMAPVPLPGGLTRVQVRAGGCDVVWANSLPVDSVPKLSARDGRVYAFGRTIAGATASYALDVIDVATGHVLSEQNVGTGPAYEALQLPPMMAPDGTLFESTVAGILRITPAG